MQNLKNKITTIESFIPLSERFKRENKKLVFTNGCFDILHRGHVEYLETAKNLGNILIVGLNSDKSVREIKGENKPITPQEDRAIVLAGLEAVDFVIIFEEPDPKELIEKILPDILAKGADWSEENIIGADYVKRHGGKVACINLTEGRSSTNIIERILKIYGK
jgi:D-glycero-beta-D-manno-heptose 1-phosphate adenylyltransferase